MEFHLGRQSVEKLGKNERLPEEELRLCTKRSEIGLSAGELWKHRPLLSPAVSGSLSLKIYL